MLTICVKHSYINSRSRDFATTWLVFYVPFLPTHCWLSHLNPSLISHSRLKYDIWRWVIQKDLQVASKKKKKPVWSLVNMHFYVFPAYGFKSWKVVVDDILSCLRDKGVPTLTTKVFISQAFLGISHGNTVIFYNLPCMDGDPANQITFLLLRELMLSQNFHPKLRYLGEKKERGKKNPKPCMLSRANTSRSWHTPLRPQGIQLPFMVEFILWTKPGIDQLEHSIKSSLHQQKHN